MWHTLPYWLQPRIWPPFAFAHDSLCAQCWAGRVLVSNEESEIARLGRENFERQTARLREEVRALLCDTALAH